MRFTTAFGVMAMMALGAFASPVLQQRVPQEGTNCYEIGDCYSSGCEGVFANPTDTAGTCSAGEYLGCPCNKCGGSDGDYTGQCNENGCMGVTGKCTAGNYEGCPCD